jgi:hypothetical protein
MFDSDYTVILSDREYDELVHIHYATSSIYIQRMVNCLKLDEYKNYSGELSQVNFLRTILELRKHDVSSLLAKRLSELATHQDESFHHRLDREKSMYMRELFMLF